mmetsp:Transcript_27902/g.96437  ORF Transcript_27902/g.96437 Transcript_27902/m.96437 type:complete len:307 (+) Transcript_27902:2-922(+)
MTPSRPPRRVRPRRVRRARLARGAAPARPRPCDEKRRYGATPQSGATPRSARGPARCRASTAPPWPLGGRGRLKWRRRRLDRRRREIASREIASRRARRRRPLRRRRRRRRRRFRSSAANRPQNHPFRLLQVPPQPEAASPRGASARRRSRRHCSGRSSSEPWSRGRLGERRLRDRRLSDAPARGRIPLSPLVQEPQPAPPAPNWKSFGPPPLPRRRSSRQAAAFDFVRKQCGVAPGAHSNLLLPSRGQSSNSRSRARCAPLRPRGARCCFAPRRRSAARLALFQGRLGRFARVPGRRRRRRSSWR